MLDIKLSDTLYQNDRIYFPKNDFTRTITKLYKNNRLVNTAYQGDLVSIEMDQLLDFQDIYKVVDAKIVEENSKYIKNEHIKLPIQMKVFGLIGLPLQLTVIYKNKKISVKSDQYIEKAQNVPLTNERIKEQLSKLGNTIFYLEKCSIRFPNDGIISIKELNNLRRVAIDKLEKEMLDMSFRKMNDLEQFNCLSKKREDHKKIAIQVSDISQLEQLDLYGVEQVFVPFYQYQVQCDKYIPYVPFLYDEQDFIEFLNSVYYQKCQSIQVNDFGALNLVNDKNIVLGYHMNITNNKAIQEFNLPFVVSYEASKNDIQSFKTNQDIYFTAYSQIINMNLKHCIISNHYFSRKQKGCHLCKQHQYCLKDRKEMTINELQNNVIEEFADFDDWMDKYALLIDLGNSLPPLEEKYKTESNLIEGCQSRVWLQADYVDGKILFKGESDAVIVKGIVSLLISILSDHTPQEILDADLYFIEKIGLKEHLSPTRSNGLVAMVKQMRMYALAFRTKEQQG